MLRFLARSALASYFVIDGIKAVRDPGVREIEFQPLAEQVVPRVKQVAPDQVASVIPNEARTLARVSGVAQVIGGLSLASGIGRRFGALVLAIIQVPQVLAASPLGARRRDAAGVVDPVADSERRRDFWMNLSLLGALLLASVDTEGKPSIGWRADRARRDLTKSADKRLNRAERTAGKLVGSWDKKARKAERKLEHRAKQAADGITK